MTNRPILSRAVSASMICALAVAGLSSCVSGPTQRRANVLEYLYPEGTAAVDPTDVQLELPLRVGVAFVPENERWGDSDALDEGAKVRLLEHVRDAFRETEDIAKIEVLPASYVAAGGGFENVDQLRSMFGFDIIALVSYDQAQVDELNMASITYWTIVGAYVIPGNENETHTMVNASIFDVRSRALLFNAAGTSVVEGRSTALSSAPHLREDRHSGMQLAIDDMIANLGQALEGFREQVKTGTVRGTGTPAVDVTRASGSGGGTGAGAWGGLDLVAALALFGCLPLRRRLAHSA